jgi:hypothetical protein
MIKEQIEYYDLTKLNTILNGIESLENSLELTKEQRKFIDSLIIAIGETYENNKDADHKSLTYKKLINLAGRENIDIIAFK